MSMLLTIKIRRPRSAPDTRVTEAAGGVLGLDQAGSWVRGQHDVHHEGGRVDFSGYRQPKMAKTQSRLQGLEVLLSPASQDSGREQDFQSRARFRRDCLKLLRG